jgi:hypothetical protein
LCPVTRGFDHATTQLFLKIFRITDFKNFATQKKLFFAVLSVGSLDDLADPLVGNYRAQVVPRAPRHLKQVLVRVVRNRHNKDFIGGAVEEREDLVNDPFDHRQEALTPKV